jgi:hypothetical protein
VSSKAPYTRHTACVPSTWGVGDTICTVTNTSSWGVTAIAYGFTAIA